MMAALKIDNSGNTGRQRKMHPHKFTLWIGIGSILMMFAGLTSAYIVKRNQASWTSFELPKVFWLATGVILVSSLTMFLALRNIRQRQMARYRILLMTTMLLGIAFVLLQTFGFVQLWKNGQTLQSTVSYSFLYIIVGLHALHVVGGVVALVVMFLKIFSTRQRNYSAVPVEVMSTYWHFVDVLWIYLLLFLLMIK